MQRVNPIPDNNFELYYIEEGEPSYLYRVDTQSQSGAIEIVTDSQYSFTNVGKLFISSLSKSPILNISNLANPDSFLIYDVNYQILPYKKSNTFLDRIVCQEASSGKPFDLFLREFHQLREIILEPFSVSLHGLRVPFISFDQATQLLISNMIDRFIVDPELQIYASNGNTVVTLFSKNGMII